MNRQREIVERALAWIEALPAAPGGAANGATRRMREAAWTSS